MKRNRIEKAFQTMRTVFSKTFKWEGAWCVWETGRVAEGKEGKSGDICGWGGRWSPHPIGPNSPC